MNDGLREKIAKLIEYNCHRISMMTYFRPRMDECLHVADAIIGLGGAAQAVAIPPERLAILIAQAIADDLLKNPKDGGNHGCLIPHSAKLDGFIIDGHVDLYSLADAVLAALAASPLSSTDRAPAPSAWQPVVNEIAVERQRQINQEGWTRQHDDSHRGGELAIAAGWYALNSPFVGHPECIGDPADGAHEAHRLFAGETAMHWPWSREWWKPKNSRSDLVRAAALIVAEIERLDRAGLTRPQPGGAVAGTERGGQGK